jgi:nucleotide-binding universal stress UspA family protein
MIKRILVGLGGTPFTTTAIERSIELARLHDAQLTGITVVDIEKLSKVGPVPMGAGAYAQKLKKHRVEETQKNIEKAVENFESRCTEAGICFQTKLEKGDPFELMIATARYHDLIIFGLRSIFDYGIVHRPKEMICKLIEEGVRPFIAVSPRYRKIEKVLIAYSGSMQSAKAMKRFIQLTPWPGVKIRIICTHKKKEEAEKLLSDASAYCEAHNFEPELQVLFCPPKVQILRHAEEWNADLIVMGNSVKNILYRKIFDVVTLHIIKNATRPLFLSQ